MTETLNRNGGEAIADALIEHGVDTVLGIPGIQLDPLFDAFHARSNQLRVVHTRHEQGAAFMALGYAQASARPGVFAVVPGPGLMNAMAAVSTAVAANAPVLGLTGQIPSYQIGQRYGIAHELNDQLAASAGVVDWVRRIDEPGDAPRLVDEAFAAMQDGREQPAILEIAPDKLATVAPIESWPASPRTAPAELDPASLDAAVEKLSNAECPAIFVGGGTLDAAPELRKLAERLNAPVIATINGRGVLPDDHRLSFGILDGQEIWQWVDVALVVGTRFLSTALAWGREQEVETVRIDIDPEQIKRPRPANVALVTSAKRGLELLHERLDPAPPSRESFLTSCARARTSTQAQLNTLGVLPELSAAVRSALPRDGILVADVTQLGSYARFAFPAYAPRTVLGPGYQATLGYGLPAALGAKLACPERKVVAVCGDGGFMFTVQELATAVHHAIAVVTVVFDNASYGNVKTIQAESYGARHIAVDLTNPDFVALAHAFGMPARRATTPAELEATLTEYLALDRPALISVPIGEVPSIWRLVQRPPSQGKVASDR